MECGAVGREEPGHTFCGLPALLQPPFWALPKPCLCPQAVSVSGFAHLSVLPTGPLHCSQPCPNWASPRWQSPPLGDNQALPLGASCSHAAFPRGRFLPGSEVRESSGEAFSGGSQLSPGLSQPWCGPTTRNAKVALCQSHSILQEGGKPTKLSVPKCPGTSLPTQLLKPWVRVTRLGAVVGTGSCRPRACTAVWGPFLLGLVPWLSVLTRGCPSRQCRSCYLTLSPLWPVGLLPLVTM